MHVICEHTSYRIRKNNSSGFCNQDERDLSHHCISVVCGGAGIFFILKMLLLHLLDQNPQITNRAYPLIVQLSCSKFIWEFTGRYVWKWTDILSLWIFPVNSTLSVDNSECLGSIETCIYNILYQGQMWEDACPGDKWWRWQLSFSPRPVSAHSTSSLGCSQTCWPQPSCILSNISHTISHPWLPGCTRNQFVTNSGWWLRYPKAMRGCEYEIIFVKSGNWIQRDRNCTDWSLLKIFRTGFSKFRCM